MICTKLLLENTLAIRPDNYEAASEPLLPKVVRCIPVLSWRYIEECAAHVLKHSGTLKQFFVNYYRGGSNYQFYSVRGGKDLLVSKWLRIVGF